MAHTPLLAKPHTFYLRPAPGWLDLLEAEVTRILESPFQKYKFVPKISYLQGVVKVHRCDWRQGLELLLRTTLAHDMEWLVSEFACASWSDLEKGLARIRWAELLPRNVKTAHIAVNLHQGFTSGTAKLRTLFCDLTGIGHSTGEDEQRIKCELRGNRFRILISMAGRPLYQRGYKTVLSAVAPLPEHHAAACVRWVLGDPQKSAPVKNVYIPFAGSGTLGFETLLVLSGAGVGAFDRSFACESFPFNSSATHAFLRKRISQQLKQLKPAPTIVWNEINAQAIQDLQKNIEAFPAPAQHQMESGDFFQFLPPFSGSEPILMLLNPPYGDRLAKKTVPARLYSQIGKHLNILFSKYKDQLRVGCICPDEMTWKAVMSNVPGEKSETRHFTHGGKDMRLVRWGSVE